jgi:hypothetical protein
LIFCDPRCIQIFKKQFQSSSNVIYPLAFFVSIIYEIWIYMKRTLSPLRTFFATAVATIEDHWMFGSAFR